ncbi:MAG: hypothetical protein IKV14_02780 [Muribaculaceae bacterium]|nr:hypothetical protein [Muribaculaceae bacterium]
MKLNFKKSLLSIFSSEQDAQNKSTEKVAHKKANIDFENKDFDRALNDCDIPDTLLEAITDIVNKPLPEVILKTIDREAEKVEIRESLRPAFCDYIKYLLLKAEKAGGEPLFIEGDDNIELVGELEEKLKLALQREEDYKNRYLSAERQKRALSDKVRDFEEKFSKQEKELTKSETFRIESNNNIRQLNKEKCQLEENVEQLKLEVDHYKQLEVNNNLMGQSEGFTESEFIESLKNKIIALETENGEMEHRLNDNEEHIKEVVESFETALHLKEELVIQAVEREKTLQARIESLQSSLEEKEAIPEGGDEVLTARLIDVTRKYQALQSELANYKNKIYEESEGELNKRIEQLNADLALANAKLEAANKNSNEPSDGLAAQMEDLREKLEVADSKYSELETKLKETEVALEEKDKEILSLKELPTDANNEIDELKAQITELQIEIQNRDNAIAEANDKIEKIQIKRERIAENKRAAKQIEELTAKLEEAEKRSEKARKDAEIARMNVVALTNEVESLRNAMPKQDEGLFEVIEEDWLVVMEPESEAEIRERAKREKEKEQRSEEEKNVIDIPFEDPAQMKLWD